MAKPESEPRKIWLTSLFWLMIVMSLIIAGLGFLGVKDETIAIRDKRIKEALSEKTVLRQEQEGLKKRLQEQAAILKLREAEIEGLRQEQEGLKKRLQEQAAILKLKEAEIKGLQQEQEGLEKRLQDADWPPE